MALWWREWRRGALQADSSWGNLTEDPTLYRVSITVCDVKLLCAGGRDGSELRLGGGRDKLSSFIVELPRQLLTRKRVYRQTEPLAGYESQLRDKYTHSQSFLHHAVPEAPVICTSSREKGSDSCRWKLGMFSQRWHCSL